MLLLLSSFHRQWLRCCVGREKGRWIDGCRTRERERERANKRRDRQKRPLYRRGPAMHTHLKQQRKERRCLSVSHSFLPPFLSSFPLWLTPSESIDSRREGRQGCRWRSVLQQQQQHCSKAMREEGTRQGNETLQMKSERGAFPLSKHSSSLFPSPISHSWKIYPIHTWKSSFIPAPLHQAY